jgi:hypothetical protein
VKRCLSSLFYPSLESNSSSILFLNSSHQIKSKGVNWKDIVISSIPFSRWYNPMWIMSIFLLFLSAPQVFPKFLLFLILVKTGLPGFDHWICPAYTPDSSKPHRTYPAISLVLSGILSKILNWIKIFSFGLSLPSMLISVIMWRFCGAWIRSEVLMSKKYQWNISLCDLDQVLTLPIFERSSSSKRFCQVNQD